ncbi:winged helix DNA-binding protein [Lentilactobacillus hilgardii]|uniref:winged helix DNA-binding protein n=1 Tax=Lentilactobacillus hilgardii TaxID=1588 RepID=UPI0021C2B0FE|nr:winged helix DNA-binding protein [Lentilactobacillus hilgardii]MCP9332771.1 winged helix DNA-binding protein [Lentilactobacillus hilgardii]MCP9349026.1 winged helix DNA-binding protein [Lentilactobacillus hilgardii]MCP9351882.1 winged helix DNA-binding protein [Lentilactobacillus hilgardii]
MKKQKQKLLNDIQNELTIFRSKDVDQRILTVIKDSNVLPEPVIKNVTINDLHVIQAIGQEDVRISEIVSKLPLTQGAVSKIIAKLSKVNLIIKKHKPDNRKDTYVSLTDDGKKANRLHMEYHQKMNQKIQQLAMDFSKDELKTINDFLRNVNQMRE